MPPATDAPAAVIERPVSASARAHWAIGLLLAGICLDAIAIVSGLLQASLVSRNLAGEAVPAIEAAAGGARDELIGLLQLVLYAVTGVVFLMWIHRAYRNLSALTSLPRTYSPGWAVGAFLVPFVNLFRPFQVMRELWHLSDPSPSVVTVRRQGRRLPTPPLVGWWWAAWLVAAFLGYVALNSALRMRTPQEILTATYASIAVHVASICAGALAIAVIRAVEAKQSASGARLDSAGPAAYT